MRWMLAIWLAWALAGGDSADLRENPAYRGWAGFKPGSTVVVSTVTMRGEVKQADVETTSRLVEVLPDKVVIETSGSMEAGDSRMPLPTEREEIPAKIAPDKLPSGKVVEETDESIEVGDRTLRVYRTRRIEERGSVHTETTRWNSGQIPGGMAREIIVVRAKQGTVTRTELMRWETAR